MARSLVPLIFDAGLPASRSDPFSSLHREMNRLFDDALRGSPGTVLWLMREDGPPSAPTTLTAMVNENHDYRSEWNTPAVGASA